MVILDGVYGVRFLNGAVNFGSGTITLRNGAVNGGDHGFRYQGRMEVQGDVNGVAAVAGHLQVHRWNAQVPSVVPGVNDYRLEVKGSFNQSGQSFELQGTSDAFPGHALTISATRLADLVE